MAVRPSLAADISRLVQELAAADPGRRESAAARLILIGTRAVAELATAAGDNRASNVQRAAALGALGAIGDLRAVAVATSIVQSGHAALALPAIDVLGSVIHRPEPQATEAFDQLAGLALGPHVPIEHRLAAVAAFDGLPDRIVRPIYEALAVDRTSPVLARIAHRQAGTMLSLGELIERGLSDDPAVVAAAVREDGADVRLALLRRAVEAVRVREQATEGDTSAKWLSVRGQLHQAIAQRGSRIAVYDLRETFERARTPLPIGFAGAVATVGDASCLEPLAAAWSAATADERWWRDHLADAFGAIVRREAMTRRHPTLKAILKRWPAAGVLVAKAAKG